VIEHGGHRVLVAHADDRLRSAACGLTRTPRIACPLGDDESIRRMATAWTTRPESAQDVSAVREVNLATFPTTVEADLVDALRDSDAWIDGLSIVAEDREGHVVGHALLTRCHIGGSPALALAPCAVLPRVQRRGVGSAAIRAALSAARAMGENLVVVLGHPDYYPRFGFVPASSLGIQPSFQVPDEALMALALDPDAETPRGTITYPAPFGV
jgi:putative acetyltransferase